MALGEVLNKRGVGSFYTMASNYKVGKQISEGIKATFSGDFKGQHMTKWGADAQLNLPKPKRRVPKRCGHLTLAAPGPRF